MVSVPGGFVAADERQLEVELVEPVGARRRRARRRSSTSGPSGVSIGGGQPAPPGVSASRSAGAPDGCGGEARRGARRRGRRRAKSTSSSTAWTSVPKRAPPPRSPNADGTAREPDLVGGRRPVAAQRAGRRDPLVLEAARRRAPALRRRSRSVAACVRPRGPAAVRAEYDVRRQARSMVRSKRRTESGAPVGRPGASRARRRRWPRSTAFAPAAAGPGRRGPCGPGRRPASLASSPLRRRPGRRAGVPSGDAGAVGRGPPQHHLVLGPGEGDVGQPQLLAPLLGDVPADVVGPSPAAGIRRRRCSARRRRRGTGAGRPAGSSRPARGTARRRSGNSRPLLRWTVQTCTASVVGLEAPAAVASASPPGRPRRIRSRSQASSVGGLRARPRLRVQELGDVAQVGERPFAAVRRRAAAPAGRRGLRPARTGPRRRASQQPVATRGAGRATASHVVVGDGRPRRRPRPAEQRGQRGAAHPRVAAGRSTASSSGQPVPGRGGVEDAARAVDDGGDPDRGEGVADRSASLWRSTSTAMSPGCTGRSLADRRGRGR